MLLPLTSSASNRHDGGPNNHLRPQEGGRGEITTIGPLGKAHISRRGCDATERFSSLLYPT